MDATGMIFAVPAGVDLHRARTRDGAVIEEAKSCEAAVTDARSCPAAYQTGILGVE